MTKDTPDQAEVRHQLFLSSTAGNHAAWGLKQGDGWATWSTVEGDRILPLWSERSGAEFCAEVTFPGYSIEHISLETLLDEMLPTLAELEFWIGTNLTSEMMGIDVPADQLAEMLRNAVVI